LVRSLHQSLNVDLKPCTVRFAAAHAPQRHRHCHVADRLRAAAAGENKVVRVNRPHLVEDHECLWR